MTVSSAFSPYQKPKPLNENFPLFRGRENGKHVSGKGRCIDNIFIDRLWRSLKYECVYLHAWETGSQAKAWVGRWIAFYNHQRPHAADGGQAPAVAYFNQIETDQQGQRVA